MYKFNKGIGKAKEASRNIDLHSNLPVKKNALGQHFKRVNNKVGIWNFSRETKPYIPHPSVHGLVDEMEDWSLAGFGESN